MHLDTREKGGVIPKYCWQLGVLAANTLCETAPVGDKKSLRASSREPNNSVLNRALGEETRACPVSSANGGGKPSLP